MKISHTQIPLKNRRKGFSLVEVIIAIGIVALLLTGFLGVFGTAQRNINRSIGAKEANMLKDSLETEMAIFKSSDTAPGVGTAFAKAFEMIRTSTVTANAVLVYQYKGNPSNANLDGILAPYNNDDGIHGSDYITQVAVRRKSSDLLLVRSELANNVVTGNVYAVRMKQLLKNNDGDLELSTHDGEIRHEVNGNVTQAASHDDYNQAVITFQAEFFRLPSNSANYVTGNNWDFTNLGNPVAVINLAVRR